MATYFSDYFDVHTSTVKRYGAFDVSLVTDLPLFIDPFLLFNSRKPRYKRLHRELIRYLAFLKEKSAAGTIDPSLLKSWFTFSEVKQNWLGFTRTGNAGAGLGPKFAAALHRNLGKLFSDFGREQVTKGSHLEKLCLIEQGVGRDKISDFTTNLILDFLCEFTQTFAMKHLTDSQRVAVTVPKVRFNYNTETWESCEFTLPWDGRSYVLLTPRDLLTKDDTWINRTDLIADFYRLPSAITDDGLRAQVNNYFKKALGINRRRAPTQQEEHAAAARTIFAFPELIDVYIRFKEDHGETARSVSSEHVEYSQRLYREQFGKLQGDLAAHTDFYKLAGNTYEEAHQRVAFLKDVIENKGGHRHFWIDGVPVEREEDVQILYRLTWFGTPSAVTREANDGRGPADFKISRSASDNTIVEFKLASNSQLRRNLQKQAEIYQRASDAKHAIKVIVYFAASEFAKVTKILKDLKLDGHSDVVLIDARRDNKPSGSKA